MPDQPRSVPADDVGRLLKQLDMRGFHFQRFDDGDGTDPGRIEPAAGRVGVAPNPTPTPTPTPSSTPTQPSAAPAPASLPPAVAAAASTMAHDGHAGALSDAFSRLAGPAVPPVRRLPGLTLNLPTLPPVALVPPSDRSLAGVFQQLLRVGASR